MIGQIIQKWRYENNLTGEKAAELVGVSQTFINSIENNKKKLSKKIFQKLSEVMDDKNRKDLIQEFFFGEVPFEVLEEFKKRVTNTKKSKNELIEVPLFNSLNELNENQFSLETIELPKLFSEGCLVLKTTDSNMEPTIIEKSYLILNKEIKVKDGEIGIFYIKNKLYIRRLKEYENVYYLFSDNDKVPPIEVKKNKIKVFAKVVSIINQVKEIEV